MEKKNIQRVLVIGPGTMGTQIAFQCALFNCQVKIYGKDINSLEKGHNRLVKLSRLLTKGKYITKEQSLAALTRIKMTSDKLVATEGVQLISESIPEKIELKQSIWNEFGKFVTDDTILTTNSSTILPSQLSEYSRYPENFLAWHFHLFCYVNNIVDIMPHSKTELENIKILSTFSNKINQTPIILQKEQKGYIFNAMLLGFLTEAIRLAVNNVASMKDIDCAWIKVMNTSLGPFGIMNSIGFDNVYNIMKAAQDKNPHNDSYKLALQWLNSEFKQYYHDKKPKLLLNDKPLHVTNPKIHNKLTSESRLEAAA
jgi:3-hydroxybutyryl-CoA dehydrogenase